MNADNGIDWVVSVAPDERIPVLYEKFRRVKGSGFEMDNFDSSTVALSELKSA